MPLSVAAAYIGMVLLWGTTWAAIKVGVTHVPPFVFALERALAVAAILTLVSLALRLPFPRTRRDLVATVVAGLINLGGSWAIIFWAEQFVPSGIVAVFGATAPVWTAFLAHFFVRGDRLSIAKLAALALGLSGTAVLVGSPGAAQGEHAFAASLLLAAMTLAWAFAAILATRALRHLSPIPAIAVEAWASMVFLAPLALTQAAQPSTWNAEALVAFAYLVIGGSCVGLVLNLWLYRKLRPTTVMLSQILIPVQAVLIGAVALGEQLTPLMLLGAALVLGAVGVNAIAGSREPSAPVSDDHAAATAAE